MAPESPPPQIELGEVVLGSGEFRLVFYPVGPSGLPTLMLYNETTHGGGGGECSKQLSWVLGHNYMMSGFRGRGPFRVFGEVAAGYQHVYLIGSDGTQANTTVLDCVEHTGFNVYVAEVPSNTLRVVATNGLGHAVSKLIGQPSFWTHETPEAAALNGWPKDSRVLVTSVDVRGDRAEVVLENDRGWPNHVHCVRTRRHWHEAISTSGATFEWDDPWPDPMGPAPR
jgi:hypothetical protein